MKTGGKEFRPASSPTYLEGPLCQRCWGTLYYAKTKHCVGCQSRAARNWRDRKKASQ